MRDEYAIEVPGTFLALRTEGDLFVNDTRRDSYMTVCKEDCISGDNKHRIRNIQSIHDSSLRTDIHESPTHYTQQLP